MNRVSRSFTSDAGTTLHRDRPSLPPNENSYKTSILIEIGERITTVVMDPHEKEGL